MLNAVATQVLQFDYPMVRKEVPAAVTLTVPAGFYLVVPEEFIVSGEVFIEDDGELVTL